MKRERVVPPISVAVVVACLRNHGPMTRGDVAEHLHWSAARVGDAIRAARRDGLAMRISKTDRGQFVFGAVQTATWPAPAADGREAA